MMRILRDLRAEQGFSMQQPPPRLCCLHWLIQTVAWVSLLTDHRGYFQKVMDKLNCRRRGAGGPLKSCKPTFAPEAVKDTLDLPVCSLSRKRSMVCFSGELSLSSG